MYKVKFDLEQAMKSQRGVEVLLYSFFYLGTMWGDGWLTPFPGRFTPGKEIQYPLEGCVGPRAGLVGCGKSLQHRDSIPKPSNP
jgi:hypothetical protein